MWFYLAGWTWLALIFWHRESIDFDFFIDKDIDTEKLFLKLQGIFKDFEVIKFFEEKNTLYVLINDVKISFFTYKYANIDNFIETPYFKIASVKDIWAMKLWAIQNRATNKDYVDLYYIIKKIGINSLLSSFFEKYSQVSTKSHLVKSLIYFEDLTEEKLILKENITFEKIKKLLIKEVERFMK